MTDTPSNRKQSSVRRANVTACQRCKSRKQRCDQNIPACSSCARAGVPCVLSYIKNLEDRVAELELSLRNQGIDTESVVSRTSQDALDSTPEAHSSNDLNLLRLLVPRPNDVQHPEGSAYHTLLDTVTVPDTIKFPPRPTAIQLTAIYFEHSNFFSPVLNQKSFHDTIAILYQDQTSSDQGTSVQKFQLCMVLAIAIRLLNDCIRLVLRVSYWNTHRKATTEHLPQRLTHDSCLSFITISPLSSSFGRRAERSRAVSF
ncbi:hypothetical protein H9Q72_002000 [Fusarium xylarioides]|uniref:Zn(2)-C6 fungal-type domain-containing protein n=1 Tax=Fusarium xylarioides TaxID=221167 RepID=A0A9P7I6Z6_9HYPO|nr:hypothetical protein H9Q72_002000 [Fusarium xylarioides]